MQSPTAGFPRPRILVLCAIGVATLSSCSAPIRSNVAKVSSPTGLRSVSEGGERPSSSQALFGQLDKNGRRLSLLLTKTGLTFNNAGDMSYSSEWTPGHLSPLERLLAGEEIQLSAFGGHKFGEHDTETVLRLRNSLRSGRAAGEARADHLLPVELVTSNGKVELTADLSEEPAGHEITVVSYNVENFFDQIDEDRNESYGDYRLQKNSSGQWSNYGTTVQQSGKTMTFTDLKAQNIRKVLQAVTPEGPEIAGLVEVESKQALNTLLEATRDLGYKYAQFSDWPEGSPKSAMGLGILSKFPILSWSLLTPKMTSKPSHLPLEFTGRRGPARSSNDAPRSILKVKVDVFGHPLLVYVNHWKSKSGPESMRKAYAQALESDLEKVLTADPRADFILLGDFNSEYNEAIIITDEHNDTNGTTGINHVLKTQGDELAVAQIRSPFLKYDLHYELDADRRRSAWHPGFNWSSLDHMIIGPGLYDKKGLTYVDGSFDIPRSDMPRVEMLFTGDGKTNRWHARRKGAYTEHSLGGFSDHLPIFARLRISPEQVSDLIPLPNPGTPNSDDIPIDYAP